MINTALNIFSACFNNRPDPAGFFSALFAAFLLAPFLLPGGSAFATPLENNRQNIFTPVNKSIWNSIKGQPAKDAIFIGMWSYHILGSGEFFGDGTHNEQHHMLGVQYGGITFGTFINCYENRVFFAGLAREVGSISYNEHTRIDAVYQVGFMHGYGNNLPNVYGISPQIMLKACFSWRRFGMDLGLTPIVASLNFRIDL